MTDNEPSQPAVKIPARPNPPSSDSSSASSPERSHARKSSKDDLIRMLLETVMQQSEANKVLVQTAQKQMVQLKQQMAMMASSTSQQGTVSTTGTAVVLPGSPSQCHPPPGTPTNAPVVQSPSSPVFSPPEVSQKSDHFLTQCENFKKLTKEQVIHWIKVNKRCWRCCRSHQAEQCDLKIPCSLCNGRHLRALHEVNQRPTETASQSTSPAPADVNQTSVQPTVQDDLPAQVYYLDRAATGSRVLLKVSKVILYNGHHSLETYAILDDGSERMILLPAATRELQLNGERQSLPLRTVRNEVTTLLGLTVSFQISSAENPNKKYKIQHAFTSDGLTLSEHSHPVAILQKRYRHLRGLPLQSFERAHPLLLIGADKW